jgi:hypothetical protein
MVFHSRRLCQGVPSARVPARPRSRRGHSAQCRVSSTARSRKKSEASSSHSAAERDGSPATTPDSGTCTMTSRSQPRPCSLSSPVAGSTGQGASTVAFLPPRPPGPCRHRRSGSLRLGLLSPCEAAGLPPARVERSLSCEWAITGRGQACKAAEIDRVPPKSVNVPLMYVALSPTRLRRTGWQDSENARKGPRGSLLLRSWIFASWR